MKSISLEYLRGASRMKTTWISESEDSEDTGERDAVGEEDEGAKGSVEGGDKSSKGTGEYEGGKYQGSDKSDEKLLSEFTKAVFSSL